ncbi:hypothetical protein PHYSODRAFT_515822, partial [Phytophthora sojae]
SMKSLVPQRWGLSFMNVRILLNGEVEGSTASSKAMMFGGMKLRWNVSWSASITGRSSTHGQWQLERQSC